MHTHFKGTELMTSYWRVKSQGGATTPQGDTTKR